MKKIKYYVRILGIWIRVPRSIFLNCSMFWTMMK